MFNPTQEEVRNFFFDVYAKANAKQDLTDLEQLAYSIILEHPEYNSVLENPVKYREHQWAADGGETNPFLHLSMHLAILEQLSINQPPNINAFYSQLIAKFNDKHEAAHHLIECLGEMIWQAQRTSTPPDVSIYFSCINSKLDKK